MSLSDTVLVQQNSSRSSRLYIVRGGTVYNQRQVEDIRLLKAAQILKIKMVLPHQHSPHITI